LRWSVVEQVVGSAAPATILEVGCGRGTFGARLATLAEYTGIEPDPTSSRQAAAVIEPNGGTVVQDYDSWAVERGTWDLVCAFEVLEHLEDDAAALTRWHGLVTPGGHLLISVPAGSHRLGPWDTLAGHYRRYDADRLVPLLEAAGFSPVRTTHYGWPLDYGLETVRNAVGRRRVSNRDPAESLEELTGGSGRLLQPGRLAGSVAAVAVRPFVAVQRRRPDRGTGLVVLARRPPDR